MSGTTGMSPEADDSFHGWRPPIDTEHELGAVLLVGCPTRQPVVVLDGELRPGMHAWLAEHLVRFRELRARTGMVESGSCLCVAVRADGGPSRPPDGTRNEGGPLASLTLGEAPWAPSEWRVVPLSRLVDAAVAYLRRHDPGDGPAV